MELNLNFEFKNGKVRNNVYSSVHIQQWNELKLYKDSEIESTFLEIIKTNKKNRIIGCTDKHSYVLVTEFTNDYMGPLLEKLPREKK